MYVRSNRYLFTLSLHRVEHSTRQSPADIEPAVSVCPGRLDVERVCVRRLLLPCRSKRMKKYHSDMTKQP